MSSRKPLRRSLIDKKIAGVCGGIAQWLDVDSTVIRVAAIVLSFMPITCPTVIIYLACWLIMDEEEIDEIEEV